MTLPLTLPKGKLKPEWMGVPIPGRRPLILLTQQVERTLANVTLLDVSLRESTPRVESHLSHNKSKEVRAIEIVYRFGKSGRGQTILYDRCQTKTEQSLIWDSLRVWAEKQRELRVRPKPKVSRGDATIKKLEREKAKLHLHRLIHPLIPNPHGYIRSEGSDRYLRESNLRWHAEKPIRRKLARIGGLAVRSKVTSVSAYKMLREGGFEFSKFSELNTRERERRPFQNDYWKHLPEFVRGVQPTRPTETEYESEEGEDPLSRHARARLEYIANKREAEMIDAQIASIRELSQTPPPNAEQEKTQ